MSATVRRISLFPPFTSQLTHNLFVVITNDYSDDVSRAAADSFRLQVISQVF